MGLVLSTKNLILKGLSLMAKHEGLRAAYEARRDIYKLDENRAEELKKRVKKICKVKRLNKLLDLGAKV